jgi:hypothetical protein
VRPDATSGHLHIFSYGPRATSNRIAGGRQSLTGGRSCGNGARKPRQALNWSSRDLFGLHTPPEKPHPSYRRLSRYDATGLIWLLQGREVVALTSDSASIRNPKSGVVTVYRRHLKPALGPLGDSPEDLK